MERDESADEVRLWADTKLRNCGEYRKIKVGQSLSFSSSFILPLALRWLWQTAHSLSPSIESITMSNDPRSPSPSGLYRGRSGVDIKERERANGESNNRMFRWTFLFFVRLLFFLKTKSRRKRCFWKDSFTSVCCVVILIVCARFSRCTYFSLKS